MALLDFIRNRNANRQQSVAERPQAQKPETAKQMYSRQAVAERTNQKPVQELSPEQLARVESIKATLQKATQHVSSDAPGPASSSPVETTGNREAVRQKMTGQDKQAPALSPTSAERGQTAKKSAPAPFKETPTRPATLPRRPPSWER